MAFAPIFQRPFSATFDRRAAVAAAVPWWLAGTPVWAYQFTGASSYAASKSNLVSPGTYDAIDGASPPGWDSTNGTTYFAASAQNLVLPNQNVAPNVIIRFSGAVSSTHILCGTFQTKNWGMKCSQNGYSWWADNKLFNNTDRYSPGITSGVIALANHAGWQNGIKRITISEYGGNQARALWLGGENNFYGLSYWTGNIQAAAGYLSISDAEVATVSAAMAAL